MKVETICTGWVSGYQCRKCEFAGIWHEFGGVCTKCGSTDLRSVGVRQKIEKTTRWLTVSMKVLSVEVSP